MKVLYICSNKISTFSENSNAYQQPFNICQNSECTIITPYKDYVSVEIRDLAKEIIQVDAGKAALYANVFGKIPLPSIAVDIESYEIIVSDFSEWSLALVAFLRKRQKLPWFIVMWDAPFGNRYEINTGFYHRFEHVLRLKAYNYLVSQCTECFAFINKGMLAEEKIRVSKVTQMVNGVDTNITKRIFSENNDLKIKNSLCATGRIRTDKGCENILDAFKVIGQKFPTATLTFIGQIDGSDSEKKVTSRLIEEHPYSSRIKVTGRIGFKEAMSIVAKSEIGLHAYSPSKYLLWNHVLKVGEYQALGVVPVATRYPGTSDIIEDHKTGLLIKSNSGTEITNAVTGLLQNRELLLKIQNVARENVEQRSWKVVTKNMLNQIEKTIL